MLFSYNKKQTFTIFAALNASLSTFIYQYAMSVYNPIQEILEKEVFPDSSITEKSFYVSGPLLGGTFGALVAGLMGKKLGRRSTMIWIQIISIIGVILTMVPNSIFFIIGRALTGFEGGVAFVIVNIYIVEISEDPLRGQLGIIAPVSTAMAVLICNGFGILIPLFADHGISQIGMKILLGVPALISIVQIFNLVFFFKFETPYYLVTQNEEKKAKEVLKLLYEDNHSDRLDVIIKEKECIENNQKVTTFANFLPGKYWKSFLASLPLITPSSMGSLVPMMFSNMLFLEDEKKSFSNTAYLITSVIGFAYFLGNLLALFIIKYIGRRTLSIIGGVLIALLNLAITLIIYWDSANNVSVKVLLVLWIVIYSPTLHAVSFIYPAETLPETSAGSSVLISYVLGFGMTHLFIPVQASIGFGGWYVIYTGLTIIGLVTIVCCMVETKDRTKYDVYVLYEETEEEEVLLAKEPL